MPEQLKNVNPEEASSYVCAIDDTQRQKLEELLKYRGWSFSEYPHAFWKANFAKINAIAYLSGKLVIQGKGTGELVLYTIEPEITGKPILGYEEKKEDENEAPFCPHAGADESGKGDIFGPLSIAIVFVDDKSAEYFKKIGVKDSKNIKSDVKIAFLAKEIRKSVKGLYSIVSVGPGSYNRLYDKFKNLNLLLAWGHARALENLIEKKTDIKHVILDKFGHESLVKRALLKKSRKIKLTQRTKAESDIAVAAASILARDAFIGKIKELSEKAGFNIPKGAGEAVEKALKKILNEKGVDAIPSYAKMHFRTVKKALGLPLDDEKDRISEETDSGMLF